MEIVAIVAIVAIVLVALAVLLLALPKVYVRARTSQVWRPIEAKVGRQHRVDWLNATFAGGPGDYIAISTEALFLVPTGARRIYRFPWTEIVDVYVDTGRIAFTTARESAPWAVSLIVPGQGSRSLPLRSAFCRRFVDLYEASRPQAPVT